MKSCRWVTLTFKILTIISKDKSSISMMLSMIILSSWGWSKPSRVKMVYLPWSPLIKIESSTLEKISTVLRKWTKVSKLTSKLWIMTWLRKGDKNSNLKTSTIIWKWKYLSTESLTISWSAKMRVSWLLCPAKTWKERKSSSRLRACCWNWETSWKWWNLAVFSSKHPTRLQPLLTNMKRCCMKKESLKSSWTN